MVQITSVRKSPNELPVTDGSKRVFRRFLGVSIGNWGGFSRALSGEGSPMNAGQTLFSQLLDCLPWSRFARIVTRHGGRRLYVGESGAEGYFFSGWLGVAGGCVEGPTVPVPLPRIGASVGDPVPCTAKDAWNAARRLACSLRPALYNHVTKATIIPSIPRLAVHIIFRVALFSVFISVFISDFISDIADTRKSIFPANESTL